jgi:hypothetical protein
LQKKYVFIGLPWRTCHYPGDQEHFVKVQYRITVLCIFILTLVASLPRLAASQTSADSSADALLIESDDPPFDLESVFDELEALGSESHITARSRAALDPHAREERAYAESQYLGSPIATLNRLKLNFRDFSVGAAFQKDPGESSLVDDWAAFAALEEQQLGPFHIDRAVAGSYSLAFASGLMFGSGIANIALRSRPAHLPSHTYGLRHALSPHSMTDLFGASVNTTIGMLRLTPFVSDRTRDARTDSNGVRTLYTYFHRTTTELQYARTLRVRTYGGHAAYADSASGFQAGATYSNTAYSLPLRTQAASLIRGSSLINSAADMSWGTASIAFAAEAAIAKSDSGRGYAAIISLSGSPFDELRLLGIYHRQDTDYYSPYGAIVDASPGDLSNEQGYWFGLESRLASSVQLSAAFDISNRLRRTSTVLTTPKVDSYIDLHYQPADPFDVAVRFRERHSESETGIVDNGQTVRATDIQSQSNVRVVSNYQASPFFKFQLRSEATLLLHSMPANRLRGIYAQIGAAYSNAETVIRIQAARFTTDDYDARLYSYISSVSGSGSILLFYGRGYHGGFSIHSEVMPHLQVEGFAGAYFYDHGRSFGTGITARQGATDMDLTLQITYSL